MRDQHGFKSERDTERDKCQHQGDTGYDIGVQHRDVVDSHDDGARNPFHAVDADGGDRADDGRDQSDANAMSSVLFKAFMMAESWNICVYQRVVKPPQTVLDFVLLKDKTIMVTIGMYKKSRMSAR